VNPPDLVGRQAILAVHTGGMPLEDDVDLDAVAATMPGMVGADLQNLINPAGPGGETATSRQPDP
jgi:cell division protease FtsH